MFSVLPSAAVHCSRLLLTRQIARVLARSFRGETPRDRNGSGNTQRLHRIQGGTRFGVEILGEGMAYAFANFLAKRKKMRRQRGESNGWQGIRLRLVRHVLRWGGRAGGIRSGGRGGPPS